MDAGDSSRPRRSVSPDYEAGPSGGGDPAPRERSRSPVRDDRSSPIRSSKSRGPPPDIYEEYYREQERDRDRDRDRDRGDRRGGRRGGRRDRDDYYDDRMYDRRGPPPNRRGGGRYENYRSGPPPPHRRGPPPPMRGDAYDDRRGGYYRDPWDRRGPPPPRGGYDDDFYRDPRDMPPHGGYHDHGPPARRGYDERSYDDYRDSRRDRDRERDDRGPPPRDRRERGGRDGPRSSRLEGRLDMSARDERPRASSRERVVSREGRRTKRQKRAALDHIYSFTRWINSNTFQEMLAGGTVVGDKDSEEAKTQYEKYRRERIGQSVLARFERHFEEALFKDLYAPDHSQLEELKATTSTEANGSTESVGAEENGAELQEITKKLGDVFNGEDGERRKKETADRTNRGLIAFRKMQEKDVFAGDEFCLDGDNIFNSQVFGLQLLDLYDGVEHSPDLSEVRRLDAEASNWNNKVTTRPVEEQDKEGEDDENEDGVAAGTADGGNKDKATDAGAAPSSREQKQKYAFIKDQLNILYPSRTLILRNVPGVQGIDAMHRLGKGLDGLLRISESSPTYYTSAMARDVWFVFGKGSDLQARAEDIRRRLEDLGRSADIVVEIWTPRLNPKFVHASANREVLMAEHILAAIELIQAMDGRAGIEQSLQDIVSVLTEDFLAEMSTLAKQAQTEREAKEAKERERRLRFGTEKAASGAPAADDGAAPTDGTVDIASTDEPAEEGSVAASTFTLASKEMVRAMDTLCVYLRVVHNFDFYACRQCSSLEDLHFRHGLVHLRSVYYGKDTEEALSASASGPVTNKSVSSVQTNPMPSNAGVFLDRLQDFVRSQRTAEEVAVWTGAASLDAGTSPTLNELQTYAEDRILQGRRFMRIEDGGRFVCVHCDKAFAGAQFVVKHIRNMHKGFVDRVRSLAAMLLNYACNPSTAAPFSDVNMASSAFGHGALRPGSKAGEGGEEDDDGRESSFRERRGGRGGRGFRGRGRGRGRGGRGHRGAGGNHGLGGDSGRSVLEYYDLDAPPKVDASDFL
eukprot:Clim_evm15s168 gene=Clim_evmTU15s168